MRKYKTLFSVVFKKPIGFRYFSTGDQESSRHKIPRTKTVESSIDYSKYVLRTHGLCGLFAIVHKGETAFIERFGKLNRNAEPGFCFTIPLIESIRTVTLREVPVPIDPQSSVTKDNVQVTTAGAVYFRVIDPNKACYETYDLLTSIVTHAQSSMRSAVGLIDLDTLFHDRSSLNKGILDSMKGAAKDWGIEILRYEITEVTPDARVSEAMDSQSIAERKRRETSLSADAQRQHDITVSDGKRQAVINESEANKRKTVLAAEAEKESKLLHAEAEAISIEKIGTALRQNPETAQYLLAKDYMENMAKMLPKSTVFLTKDISDIAKLVSSATAISSELLRKI